MRQGRARIALLGFACACGSDRENPSVVRDTSGATFAWRCNEDGCTAEPQGPLPDATCGDFYGNSHGRFVEICVARRNKIGWSTTPDQCRLVVCQADTDCPQWKNEAFVCRNGLCRNDSAPLSSSDAIGLCLDAVPRSSNCAAQFTDSATIAAMDKVSKSCPPTAESGSCQPAPECRQP